jgi:acyl-CoA thioesterase
VSVHPDFARQMLAEDRASAHLGIHLVRCEPGSATLTMAIADFMVNGHRIAHGAFIFALADSAFAVACNGYGQMTVAASATIDFIAPTLVGDQLTADARERVRYGRSGIYDVTVRRGEDIIAEFRGNSRQINARTG